MEKSSSSAAGGGMLSRDQLIYLFDRFHILTSQPDVKQRIVNEKQEEAVAVTTSIQQDIFVEMGVDPHFGLSCLAKVNLEFHNDLDFMIRFYAFVANEEMVCEEAELGPLNFQLKMEMQLYLQEQQLEMLKHMRNFNPDHQSAIIQKIRQQMEVANFAPEASLLSVEQINHIVG